MHYREVINLIKAAKLKRVLVTGPQRSGTTITGKILAQELGFQYIDEMEIHVDNFHRLFNVYQQKNFVLQAPGLCAYAHMMPGAVVLMRRPIMDIIKSQQRIKWVGEKRELSKYFAKEGIISNIKYEAWDNWQKGKPNMFEIDYDSIKDHPLYIKERENFKPKQTE